MTELETLRTRNADLEEQVAYLRSELRLVLDGEQAAVLRSFLAIETQGAYALSLLYAAQGRPMSAHRLVEALPACQIRGEDRDPKQANVVVFRLRKQLGADKIQTVAGIGYTLTDAGRALVRDTLARAKMVAP